MIIRDSLTWISAWAFSNQFMPRITSWVLESETTMSTGIWAPSISMTTLDISPRATAFLPSATMRAICEGLWMVQPSFSRSFLLMMQIPAPVSTMILTGRPPIFLTAYAGVFAVNLTELTMPYVGLAVRRPCWIDDQTTG